MRTPAKPSSRNHENLLLTGFLTLTGLALGAGLYESRVVIPRWAAEPEPAKVGPALEHSGHLASGQKFWPLVGLPIVPLTALNLRAAWRCEGPRRPWWLASSGTIGLACAATAGYFVPELHRLAQAETLPAPKVRTMVAWRVKLDWVRLIAGLAAWLAGLAALSQERS